jgi:triosephosphate isomerase
MKAEGSVVVVKIKRALFLAGNWKMYNGPGAARSFLSKLAEMVKASRTIEKVITEHRLIVALFPPALSLHVFCEEKRRLPFLKYGIQNVHWEKEGAYTGEISVPMLQEMGCDYAIIGHSERRQLFGETDISVGKKVCACLAGGITPVLCVGETLEERERNLTFDVVEAQLTGALKDVSSKDLLASLVVAYEPVWAIGTGKNAKDEDAQDVCHYIRKLLSQRFGEETGEAISILYGGSVKPGNVRGLLQQADIDGALIGGASLRVESYLEIIEETLKVLAF